MLKVIDYLKKEEEILERVQYVKQLDSQIRFKRSDDNLKLPENFKVGQVVADGNCFFDSFRQGLEQQLGIKVTVEQLWQYCKEFAQNNPPGWFINAIANSHDNNGVVHKETPDSYIGNILNSNRWGDPEVEGRILCEKYRVKLHIVEKHIVKGEEVWLSQVVSSEGSRFIDSINYNEKNTIHVVNRGNAHFEPILSTQEVQQSKQQSSNYDTPEEELINTIKNHDSEEKKLAKLEKLFEKEPKPDINFQGEDGRTPLNRAAEGGKWNIVKFLVEKGADVNAVDKYGRTALNRAIESRKWNIVKFLIEKGADVNAMDKYGRTPLNRVAYSGNLDVVKFLIEKGVNINTKDGDERTALNRAAESGSWDIVRFLTEKGADVNAMDKYGKTPLSRAIESGNLDMVKFLIEKGADVNVQDGWTPLAESGKLDVIKFLVEKGADVNAMDKYGRTALNRAAYSGNLDVVKFLVEKGANVNTKDGDGRTALNKAIESGKLDIVKFLVEKGADVNTVDKYGKTPLSRATYSEKWDIVKFLVERGTDVNAQDGYGRTPLDRAAYSGKLDIVRFLVEKGADVNAQDGYGRTSLHLAAKGGYQEILQLLLNKQADPNIQDKNGKTSLDLAQEKLAQAPENDNPKRIAALLLSVKDKSEHQKVMNHLSRVEKISDMAMNGVMVKSALSDFLNEDYQGVAINVGFIAGGQEATSIKGFKLTSERKLLLLRVASPFLARGTSTFVIYDLVNQIKTFKNGTKEALVSVVGDSIYLGVDSTEIGIEIAEGFEVLEGVSGVTGPTTGSVIFVGTDIYNAIGLSADKTGDHTLISLGKGKDYAKGFSNIFVVNNGSKEYYGGNKDDVFVLQGDYIKGYLSGQGGINTLDTTSFAFQEEPLSIQLRVGEIADYYRDNWLKVCEINKVIGRENKAETITVSCDGCNSNVKLIDGQSGNKEIKDRINIIDDSCSYQMQIIIRPNTVVYNRALKGSFDYVVPLNSSGSAELSFIYGPERFNVNNTFWFAYEPIDIKSIDVKYINVFNRTEHEVKFNFVESDKEFNVTISYPENPSYRIGNSGEIKIGSKDNLYMLQSSNESAEEIIKNYLPIANRLSKMSFFIQSLLSNETVVIGSGNHEVIHNNPSYKSHLVGNGGENVYVIDSEVAEVIIHDIDEENSIDTIDLRNIVKKVKDNFELQVIKSGNDLLLRATVEKHEYFTVRLKDGVERYNKTHVIVENAPMRISVDNNEWSLKPQPLVFEKDKEVIVVTDQDVDKGTEIITPRKGGNYTFVRSNGNDLMITNAFDIKNDFCSITLSKFYEIPKMETLSIKFADKEIMLKDHQKEISTARYVNVVEKEYTDRVYNDVLNRYRQQNVTNHHIRHRRHKKHVNLDKEFSENIKNSSARPSSWINDLFGWVKGSVSGLLDSKSSKSSISQPMDINGTIMLLDVLVRKVTGQEYISAVDQSIPLLEAIGYALNITNRFEKVLSETAIKSGISVTNLNFDPVVVQSAIIGKIINGKFSEISKILYSFAKEACPEFRQTDKFLAHLKINLESEKEAMLLQQKVEEKPSKILNQQVSRKVELFKKPDSFLNGTSVVKGISNVLEL